MLAVTAALALLAPAAAVAEQPETTPTDDPTEAAAGWLATRLVDGERMEVEFDGQTFPDQGLTADVVLALAGAGVAVDQIEGATDWLEGQAGAYTGPERGEVYAGATAKLALTLIATDRDTTVGDLDLIAQLEDREQDTGRFTDTSDPDFSNTITQSLAVLALHRAEATAPSASAVDYLAAQACDDGGFPQELDPEECVSQADATGFAVQALDAVDEADALADAAAWLADTQDADGGFVGAQGTANANSTGLAAVALDVVGLDDEAAAARAFLLDLQEGCEGSEPGSIRYDDTDDPQVGPARATSQALPAVTRTSLADVTSTGASDAVPTLDCPDAEPPSFSDVSADNVHHDAIVELAERGVLEGHGDGTFRPADDLTRAQLASVLARAGDVEPVEEDEFTDIEGSPHAGAINALARAGVIDGYEDGTFRPQAPIRRDHVAALIARWLDVEPVEDDRFDDLDATIHRPLINALADLHVVEGDGEGNFNPDRAIRRDQTASLVLRALNVLEHREG